MNADPANSRLTNSGPMNGEPAKRWSGYSGMNETEDRLRAASQALLERFPDGAVPPLRLPAQPAVARRSAGRQAWRRGRPWLIPLAAAAAVLAVVALPPTLSRSVGQNQPGTAAPGPGGTPPYFVTNGFDAKNRSIEWSNYLVVRSTVTGNTLATAKLPYAYNRAKTISGAANDRTFAVADISSARDNGAVYVRIFMLNFDPNHGTATVSTPSIGRIPSGPIGKVAGFCALALSPDGLELAVATSRACFVGGFASAAGATTQITVYNLATGGSRSWRSMRPAILTGALTDDLVWSANGRLLGFAWQPNRTSEQHVSWLNTDAPGDVLPLGSSFPLPAVPRQAVPTSDGSLLTFQGNVITRYVQTGRQLRAVSRTTTALGMNSIVWANSTGRVVIMAGVGISGSGSAENSKLAVLSRGHSWWLPSSLTPVTW
jgi:hypothetical protein